MQVESWVDHGEGAPAYSQPVYQTVRYHEGVAKDISKSREAYVQTDFMILDMADDNRDTPLILSRLFLLTPPMLASMLDISG